jgi:uncharacterized protein YgiM (DUF1202 family)
VLLTLKLAQGFRGEIVDISRKTISITLLGLGGVLIVYLALLAGKTPDASARGKGSIDKDTSDHKITLCHKGHVTITVDEHAWPAHERHGDGREACQNAAERTLIEPTVIEPSDPTVVSEALLTGKVRKTNDSDSKYALKTRRGSTVKLETKKQDEQLLDQYVGKTVKVKGKLTTPEGKGKSKTKKLEVESIVEKR